MNKVELLATLRKEREEWEVLIGEIGNSRMNEHGLAGNWSAQDIVAHITWYESETIGMIETRALEGSELWLLPQDERNKPIYEESKDRSLENVLTEAEQVYERLLRAIETLSEEELSESSKFKEMPAEWIPWKVIASNTFEHYHQHMPDVREWLDKFGRAG